jgi:integrase
LGEEDRAVLSSVVRHHLRHAFATLANTQGASLPTIKALLGHSASGVTEGYIGRADRFLLTVADQVSGEIESLMGDQIREGTVVQLPNAEPLTFP